MECHCSLAQAVAPTPSSINTPPVICSKLGDIFLAKAVVSGAMKLYCQTYILIVLYYNYNYIIFSFNLLLYNL